jgi:putative methyltransferase (TIGR04325 family)
LSKLKSNIKLVVPPIFLNWITHFFYGWSSTYSNWEEASKKCSGYDSDIIINKVKESLLKVKNGEALYERDSVIFDKVHYSFPLLSALFYVALRSGNKLNVLDFGGSLGSSYFQNRTFFKKAQEFHWSIVEQKHFVTEGKKCFSDEHLHFYYDIEACLAEQQVNVLLLSSVIQYIENPYELIAFLKSKKIQYVVIDRTPLLIKGQDRITIQKVQRNIYDAKYPCWLLNQENVKNAFLKEYELIFDTELEEAIHVNNAAYKAFFFKLKQ